MTRNDLIWKMTALLPISFEDAEKLVDLISKGVDIIEIYKGYLKQRRKYLMIKKIKEKLIGIKMRRHPGVIYWEELNELYYLEFPDQRPKRNLLNRIFRFKVKGI